MAHYDLEEQEQLDTLKTWWKMHGNLVTTVVTVCLLYTSPSPRDRTRSRMPSSACKKTTTPPATHTTSPTSPYNETH